MPARDRDMLKYLVTWHLRHEEIVYSEEALLWGTIDMLPFPALS
jgi:hypothetical protein